MLTFRRKILLGYGTSLILMVVVLAWAMFLLLRLGRASNSIICYVYLPSISKLIKP